MSPEQYREISEFQYGLQKEIPYRNLCDYRIYQVTYSFTRKPEAPWGFQYPDDTTYDMLVMTAKKTFIDDDYDILPEYLSVPCEIMHSKVGHFFCTRTAPAMRQITPIILAGPGRCTGFPRKPMASAITEPASWPATSILK